MKRSWALVAISLGMVAYAAMVGRHLGSVFFLSAMCWGWVAVCGLRGRLEAARDMAIVMSVLTLVAILAVLVAGSPRTQGSLLSLGLLPSLVIWGCVVFYVQYLRRAAGDIGEDGGRRMRPYWREARRDR